MLFADLMAWVFGISALLAGLTALWLLCAGLWPRAVERTVEDLGRGIIKPLLVGIPITLIVAAAFIGATKLPNPFSGVLGVGLGSAFLLYAGVGIAGLATVVGKRLPSPVDTERPWKATIRGSLVLGFVWVLPFVGWFVLMPASIFIGAGATLRSLISAGKAAKKPQIVVEKPISSGEMHLDGGTLGAST